MKKYLLLGLSVSVCLASFAQVKVHAVKQNTLQPELNRIDKSVSAFYQSNNKKPVNKPTPGQSTRAVSKKYFTSSYNCFGVLLSEQNCLNANNASGLVAFTHRLSQDWNVSTSNPSALSGYIQCTFTSDDGATFDSLLLNQDVTNWSRYPSGTIFNPSGNTTIGNMLSVVTGPNTPGTGWVGNYFASSKFDKTANNVTTLINGSTPVTQHMCRINLNQAGNNVFVTGSLVGDPVATTAAAYAYRGATINKGAYNSTTNNFTWTIDSIIPSCLVGPSADPGKQVYSTANIAFNAAGTVGYIVFTGIDAAATGDKLAYQPIVYKSTDGGSTWTKMPAGDFSNIPSINSRLTASAGGTKKAFYSKAQGYGVVVDANDNLHIFSQVLSGASDNVDSLGYTWTRADYVSYLYDTYTTSTGWDAMFVDSLICVTGEINSPFSGTAGVVDIDARLQISTTTDRTKLFYVWIDSDPNQANGENIFPDIKAMGYNVTNNSKTPVVMFTNSYDNFFMFASTTTLVSGTTYKIPCTTSDSRGATGNSEATFDHYYVTGVEFQESDFVAIGINETENSVASISQNYPNPFSKETSISVTLKESSEVSLDVFNAIGQKVLAIEPQNMNTGVHTLKIDGTNLNAGIYFYTIKVGNTAITRKMIVK